MVGLITNMQSNFDDLFIFHMIKWLSLSRGGTMINTISFKEYRLKATKREELFFLFVIIIIAATIRLFFVLRHDFPINDGGFFYHMIVELQKNHYILPIYTSYNQMDIPFAYPPLSLYITTGLADILKIDLFDLFRFLPLLVNLASIPAFYILSRRMLGRPYMVIFSTLAFALLPPSYKWQIMGGGVTRSWGLLFLILAWAMAIHLKNERFSVNLILCSLLLGLTGLCHLEIYLLTSVFILITMTYQQGIIRGGIFFILCFVGSLILMLPYLITIASHHGIEPFIAALASGEFDFARSVGTFLLSNITYENLFTPFLVIAFLSLGWCLNHRLYLLPLYTIIIVFVNARSLERNLMLPMSMLIGIGIEVFVLPLFTRTTESGDIHHPPEKHTSQGINLMGMFFISFILLRSILTATLFLNLPDNGIGSLSQEDRMAMSWVSENTDDGSKFILLTNSPTWSSDYVSEWFPALGQRKSLFTVQGSEWLMGNRFEIQKDSYDLVSECLLKGASCLEEVVEDNLIDYNYLYLSGYLVEIPDSGGFIRFPLVNELKKTLHYELVYENPRVTIFKNTNNH